MSAPGHADARASPAIMPLRLLRLEGAVVLTAAVLVWAHAVQGSWLLFALVFFLPDLSMLGYSSGPRVGAISYNLAHTYASPALLAMVGLVGGSPIVWRLAIVWVAHIGLDRMLGYGLKHPTAFRDTHLGTIGRPTSSAAATPPASTPERRPGR